MIARNKLLSLDDVSLLQYCVVDCYKSTGKGGQKKNKTSSAVRLNLKDSDIFVTCDTYREQSLNKRQAITKLRHEIAYKLREKELEKWQESWQMNLKNPKYPLLLAIVLDTLKEFKYQISSCATFHDISTNQFMKFIVKNKSLYQFINQERQKLNLKMLRL